MLKKKTWIIILLGILLLALSVILAISGVASEARAGDTVIVDYRLMLDDGPVYSTGDRPLRFTVGEGKYLPGFEEAVIGMRAGESKTVRLPAEKAYGPYHPELVKVVSRSELPEGLQPVVGQRLQMKQQDGTPLSMVVAEVAESAVTLDANFPLAGKNLTYEIELLAIVQNPAQGDGANQTILAWALPALAVLASGLTVFYLKRRRKLRPVRVSRVGESERLLAELARLDNNFEHGKIAEVVYRRVGAQKKARVAKLRQQSNEQSGDK